MKKIRINMYAGGLDIKGQGVGANFFEQVELARSLSDFEVSINDRRPRASDINHFHTINPRFLCKYRKSRINICYVHFIPEYDDGSLSMPKGIFKIYKRYVIKFYKKADEVIVVNPYYIPSLIKNGIRKDIITYIPNYVSGKTWHPLAKESIRKIKQEYGIPEDVFVVLGVGQTQTRKGILDFKKVAEMNPDIQFVWAGGFSFGKLTSGYEEIRKLMEKPPQNLKFLGIVDRSRMNDVYNMSDMLFLPSYQELFPMTLLECINVEKPFLVRDLDLYRSIFPTVYLCRSTNEEFSDEIRRLKSDEAYYDKIKKDSLTIRDHYSYANVRKIWNDYYHRIYAKYPDKHR